MTKNAGVNLAAVATRAGVSKATASKVFNGRSDVAAATRDRVMAAAADLRYVAPGRRPATVGAEIWVAISSLSNPYTGLLLDGMLAEADLQQATIVLGRWSDAVGPGPTPSSPEWIGMGLQRGAQGFILVTTPVTQAHLDACRDRVPLMVVDPQSHAPAAALSVGATNWRGGVQATEHLLSLGHQRIAFIGGNLKSTPGGERFAGFQSALVSAGLEPDPQLVQPGRFRYEDGQACLELLMSDARPTAIFAANDAVACGVISAARRAGLEIPGELSVVGFDDSNAALGASPQLTTVRQPLVEMGRLALRGTLSALRAGTNPPPHLELATTLILRGSTGPVAYSSS